MGAFYDFFIFLLLVVGGVIFEKLAQIAYFKITNKKFKEHHFSFSRYIYLLIFPLLATFIMIQRTGSQLLLVCLSFALVGTFLEWLIGFFYHKIVGQKLWTYHRYSLSGYTSLLSIPLWGLAGALFWLLAKIFI